LRFGIGECERVGGAQALRDRAETTGIGQLLDELPDQIVIVILVLIHQLRRNAPHVDEALVPGEDPSRLADHENAVGGRVQRRLQECYSAARFPLVALPLAEITSDDHCACDLSPMRHR